MRNSLALALTGVPLMLLDAQGRPVMATNAVGTSLAEVNGALIVEVPEQAMALRGTYVGAQIDPDTGLIRAGFDGTLAGRIEVVD